MTWIGGSAVESEWSAERLAAAVAFVVGRVRADVGPVGGVPPEAVVAARVDPAWSGEAAGPPESVVAVVFSGRHEFPLGLEDGVESACRSLADQVQDDVTGELGRPWPELRTAAGEWLGVLEPALADSVAVWALRGRGFCGVGQLAAAVAAAGLVCS